jgi:hypothetical protein
MLVFCTVHLISLKRTHLLDPLSDCAPDDEIRPRRCGGAAGGGAAGDDDGGVRRGSERVRQANATARLTTKPPLCQECAKTRKNSPTIARPAGHQPAADLGIPGRKALRENAVDMLAGIYTPALSGSMPSVPTSV